MLPKIYVDGQEGTTGLRIHEILAARTDVQTLKIAPEKRKDLPERKRFLNEADLVFLCLPDSASREAVALIDNPRTKVIDASTAFRTDDAWAFGLPELAPDYRANLRTATRIANPGCHATAFLLAVRPLVAAGIIAPSTPLTCFSLTGYSGGGKKMIADYESPTAPASLKAGRHYALKLTHKHLPEMQKHAGLSTPPLFQPVVCNVHSGLAVEIFLPSALLAKKVSPQDVHEILAATYAKEHFVKTLPLDPDASGPTLDNGFFDITAANNTNRADLFVFGHDSTGSSGGGGGAQISLIARLDNLGKGASGAAIQSMNLALGFDESTGLSA